MSAGALLVPAGVNDAPVNVGVEIVPTGVNEAPENVGVEFVPLGVNVFIVRAGADTVPDGVPPEVDETRCVAAAPPEDPMVKSRLRVCVPMDVPKSAVMNPTVVLITPTGES